MPETIVKAEQVRRGLSGVYDVEHMRARSKMFVAEINEFMQGHRVLCVSTRKESDEMWTRNAQDHMGIMLRIEPNLTKDSKFQPFRPVTYSGKRPPLYGDTLQFIADSLFGDQEGRRKAILEKIIYTKMLRWKYESEYRLSKPLRKNEEPWDTLAYRGEEITELYLGLAMKTADREEVVRLAKAVNRNIIIFRATREMHGKIRFERI